MSSSEENIITVNAGSSSIKLDIFMDEGNSGLSRTLSVSITGIGQPQAMYRVRCTGKEDETLNTVLKDQNAATEFMLEQLKDSFPSGIKAIGHRIVHGGPKHSSPELITDSLIKELASFADFDPEHSTAALNLVEAMRSRFPGTPQIACFDSAFFSSMPRVASQLPLPRKYEDMGLKRYGFHGLSYTYLLVELENKAGEDAAEGRVIMAHLGSGASLAATHMGKPIDTTMSFSPASGIMMSSRSGDLDPAIVNFLHSKTGMSVEDFNKMVNFESGLLGVSGVSADMYTLLQQEATNPSAKEAVNLFVYQVKKAIGALAAALGGVDYLVFSGGIGEQSAPIRSRVCDGLSFLGIELDQDANDREDGLISTADARVKAYVLPADEAQVIASQARSLVTKSKETGNN